MFARVCIYIQHLFVVCSSHGYMLGTRPHYYRKILALGHVTNVTSNHRYLSFFKSHSYFLFIFLSNQWGLYKYYNMEKKNKL